MADKEQPRSIRFPQRLWDAIDRDAVRCGRSAVKQLEVLLSTYYGLRDVDLDYNRMALMRGELIPQGIEVAPTSRSGGIPLVRNSKEVRRVDVPHKKKNKRVA